MTTLNNKTLTIVLVALVVVYLGAKLVRSPKRERMLDIALVNIDTSTVAQIKLYPTKEQGREVHLTRSGTGWNVEHDGLSAEADSNAVKALMGSFIGMEASRVVTGQSSNWDTYQVGDTSGTRVVVLGDGDIPLGEWWVGEAPSQGGPYGGGQSYVRLSDGDRVYAVDGYLHSQCDKPFTDWRNKAFLRLAKGNISGVTAAGASDWSLKRDSTAWLLDGARADSAAVERYINRFASMNLPGFADGFSPTAGADARLTVHSAVGDLANIQAWKETDSTWVVQSSQRPNVYFTIGDERFTEEVIPDKSGFREK